MLGSDRLFGSSLDKPDAPAPTRAALDQVHVAIDLIIFSDGQMLGENQHEYHRLIEERHAGMKDVVNQLSQEHSASALSARVVQLREQTKGRDRRSLESRHWLNLLAASPNVEGTLKEFQSYQPLPHFHR